MQHHRCGRLARLRTEVLAWCVFPCTRNPPLFPGLVCLQPFFSSLMSPSPSPHDSCSWITAKFARRHRRVRQRRGVVARLGSQCQGDTGQQHAVAISSSLMLRDVANGPCSGHRMANCTASQLRRRPNSDVVAAKTPKRGGTRLVVQ